MSEFKQNININSAVNSDSKCALNSREFRSEFTKDTSEIEAQIKENAIFIADAHENSNKTAFLSLLKSLNSGKIELAPQIFLLGDIFDFLTDTTYVKSFYSEYIVLLNELSEKTEIFYFEGNHDFNLQKIFPKIRVFSINSQPVKFSANGEIIAIAHGDIFLNLIDTLFLRFLRNKIFLFVANLLDIALNFAISKAILKSQEHKKLDYIIPNFAQKIQSRISFYKVQKIIEGHYHQGVNLQINDKFYINLSCFACKRSYFVVKYKPKLEFQVIRSPNA